MYKEVDILNIFPKISIIIATYNRVEYLQKTLNKLLKSKYPDFEIIVIDGGSTDGTVELLKSYKQKLNMWVSEKDSGESDALNKGLRIASGEIIKIMSDDDILAPEALYIVGKYFAERADVDIVFGQVNVWKIIANETIYLKTSNFTDDRNIRPKSYFNFICRNSGLPTHGAFIRRSVFGQIGVFSTKYIIWDYEYWARAIFNGVQVGLLSNILGDYYITGENTVIKKEHRIRYDGLGIVWKYGSKRDVFDYILRQMVCKYIMDGSQIASSICHGFGFYPLRYIQKLKVFAKAQLLHK